MIREEEREEEKNGEDVIWQESICETYKRWKERKRRNEDREEEERSKARRKERSREEERRGRARAGRVSQTEVQWTRPRVVYAVSTSKEEGEMDVQRMPSEVARTRVGGSRMRRRSSEASGAMEGMTKSHIIIDLTIV